MADEKEKLNKELKSDLVKKAVQNSDITPSVSEDKKGTSAKLIKEASIKLKKAEFSPLSEKVSQEVVLMDRIFS